MVFLKLWQCIIRRLWCGGVNREHHLILSDCISLRLSRAFLSPVLQPDCTRYMLCAGLLSAQDMIVPHSILVQDDSLCFSQIFFHQPIQHSSHIVIRDRGLYFLFFSQLGNIIPTVLGLRCIFFAISILPFGPVPSCRSTSFSRDGNAIFQLHPFLVLTR